MGRAHAVLGEAVLDLVLGLGEVDVDRQLALRRELGDPAQRLLADGVDRVRRQRRLISAPSDASATVEARGARLPRIARRPRRRASISGAPIVARRPASRTARAVASGCQYMSQKRAVPVRIISSAGEPRPPVDVLALELRLDRPDLLLQPAHQRQVAAVAAEQGHRRVGVAVDRARRSAPRPPRRSSRRRARARPRARAPRSRPPRSAARPPPRRASRS